METILGLILLEIVTSGISFATLIKESLNIIKNAADEGYLVDIDKIDEIGKIDAIETRDNILLYLLIPVYNFIFTSNLIVKLRNCNTDLIDRMSVAGIAKKMSKIEQEEYLKAPTVINALHVREKVHERLAKAQMLIVDSNGLEGTIIYDYTDGKLNILKTTGNLLYLTEEKRKELIKNGILPTKEDEISLTGNDDIVANSTPQKDVSLKLIRTKKDGKK